jgi:hypothetical protein
MFDFEMIDLALKKLFGNAVLESKTSFGSAIADLTLHSIIVWTDRN